MMTYDLEILKELFLPLLEEMAPHSSGLTDISRDEMFWAGFNNALLGTPGQLRHLLADYKITDIERYAAQFESLKAEYIAWLAQCYCAGQSSPAITLLLEKADAAFTEEVAFQRHMLAAITQAGRAAIKNELKLSDEFVGADISDAEISGAFNALHRDVTRNELKRQLQQWDEEELPMAKPAKRKRIGAIPFLFLRLAAAAFIGAGVIIVVVKVYNGRNGQGAPAVRSDSVTGSNNFAATDTVGKADTLHPNIGAGTYNTDSAKAIAAHPIIILKGNVVDTASNEVLRDVTITMVDDKGEKQTVFSKDGKFLFRLPLHHDFVITGKKEGYHSARLSLSTRDAREADAGEVIEVVLRFSKDP
jgi:hypothetical protein